MTLSPFLNSKEAGGEESETGNSHSFSCPDHDGRRWLHKEKAEKSRVMVACADARTAKLDAVHRYALDSGLKYLNLALDKTRQVNRFRSLRQVQSVIQMSEFPALNDRHAGQITPFPEAETFEQTDTGPVIFENNGEKGCNLQFRAA